MRQIEEKYLSLWVRVSSLRVTGSSVLVLSLGRPKLGVETREVTTEGPLKTRSVKGRGMTPGGSTRHEGWESDPPGSGWGVDSVEAHTQKSLRTFT